MFDFDWKVFLNCSAWFGAGIIIGYIWGKASSTAKKVDKMSTERREKNVEHHRNERGAARLVSVQGAFMFVVVIITAWAAVSSARTSQEVQNQSEVIQAQGDCTSKILFGAIDALNQRTQYSSTQTDANITLQKSQLNLLRSSFSDTLTEQQRRDAFLVYLRDLEDFVTAVTTAQETNKQHPYPTPAQYASCLEDARNSG